MKLNLLYLFALLAFPFATASAADVNMKWGKPTQEEMQMTVYDAEPNAEAVVLCRLTEVEYTVQTNSYLVDYHEKMRIKVLKPSGTRFAKVVVPYKKFMSVGNNIGGLRASFATIPMNRISGDSYFGEESGSMSESVFGTDADENVENVKATAFNLEGSKVAKTSMKKSSIATKQIDEHNYQLEFTVPNVKEGTVIEYEYTIHSQIFWELHDWYAQWEIPVVFAKLDMNMLAKPMTVNTNHYIYIGRNLMGMPKDDSTWNVQDSWAGITAELKTYRLRGMSQMDFAKTWDQIDEMILTSDDLGIHLNDHSPLADELKAAKIDEITDLRERAAAVYKLVMSKVKWNGKYTLSPAETSETLKKGEGSNADINLLLIQSMNTVGLTTAPVVLRTRDLGMLPYNFPSFTKLSTFIVAVIMPSGGNLYLDASNKNGRINKLPEVMLVERARLVRKDKKSSWVNLQKIFSKNQGASN